MRLPTALVIVFTISGAAAGAQSPAAKPVFELKNIRPLTPEGKSFMGPVWSPNGLELAVTQDQYTGLFLVPAKGGALRELTGDFRAGYRPRFSADGMKVFYSTTLGNQPVVMEASLTGGRTRTSFTADEEVHPSGVRVKTIDDAVFVTTRDGQTKRITQGEDRYFAPVFSPDGKKILFNGLATGLHVYHIETGARMGLGKGSNGVWTPDSSRVIFDVSDDDGHNILASDLYLFDINRFGRLRITNTPRELEMRPAISPDGKTLAWDSGGRVYAGVLVEKLPGK
ncbi:MAG: Protein TolB [Myxococcota bacterium]|nr:Protein TolB [Myxococcota bacterium]